jgi:hypothetical protein
LTRCIPRFSARGGIPSLDEEEALAVVRENIIGLSEAAPGLLGDEP